MVSKLLSHIDEGQYWRLKRGINDVYMIYLAGIYRFQQKVREVREVNREVNSQWEGLKRD